MTEPHAPVMVAEVVTFLGGCRAVVDATVGAGGHAAALLEAGVRSVVGIDRDLSVSICEKLQKKHQLERRQIAINCSHTHRSRKIAATARSTPSAPPGRSNIATPITAPSRIHDEDHKSEEYVSVKGIT